MLIVLSPAKTLDESPAIPAAVQPTVPQFARDASALAKLLAGYSEPQMMKLMGISAKLAALNAGRYVQFSETPAHPCAWMFRGDVYTGLDIDTLPDAALPALQDRVRILSGMYGLLRPFDTMRPYRLEMGTTLKTAKGKNLYDYWGTRIAAALNDAAEAANTDVLLNLASQEYSAAIAPKALKLAQVNVHFKERKGNKLQVIGLFAKKARGTMARWVAEHAVGAKDVFAFDADGYRFDRELSDPTNLTFVRSATSRD